MECGGESLRARGVDRDRDRELAVASPQRTRARGVHRDDVDTREHVARARAVVRGGEHVDVVAGRELSADRERRVDGEAHGSRRALRRCLAETTAREEVAVAERCEDDRASDRVETVGSHEVREQTIVGVDPRRAHHVGQQARAGSKISGDHDDGHRVVGLAQDREAQQQTEQPRDHHHDVSARHSAPHGPARRAAHTRDADQII